MQASHIGRHRRRSAGDGRPSWRLCLQSTHIGRHRRRSAGIAGDGPRLPATQEAVSECACSRHTWAGIAGDACSIPSVPPSGCIQWPPSHSGGGGCPCMHGDVRACTAMSVHARRWPCIHCQRPSPSKKDGRRRARITRRFHIRCHRRSSRECHTHFQSYPECCP